MIVSTSMSASSTSSVFDAEHRTLTIGLLLVITLVAFENLAVVTIAPTIARSLDGLLLYGWVFSGQLLASLFSIVVAGQEADRAGPARPFMLGLILFTLGLVVAGFAPSMQILILGRILQGLGGGAVTVAVYVAVNLAYSDTIRARMIAFMSTAWVIPALAGPAAAGFIAEWLGWRYVFLIMLPLILLVALMTLRAFMALERQQEAEKSNWQAALFLVLGAGVLLAGLSMENPFIFALMVILGFVATLPSLYKLLPKGTMSLGKGLPSVIAARGFFYASFVGVEAFIALMLTSVHEFSSAVTGVAIATGAISWTLGSWSQDQWDKRAAHQRHVRIFIGSSIMTLGLVLQLVSLYTTVVPLIITLIGWMLAGFGIGLAHSTTSVLAFALAPKGEEGHVSAGLQLADTFLAALATGVGGALFAYATRQGLGEQTGIMLAFVFSLFLSSFSIISAMRIGSVAKPQASSSFKS